MKTIDTAASAGTHRFIAPKKAGCTADTVIHCPQPAMRLCPAYAYQGASITRYIAGISYTAAEGVHPYGTSRVSLSKSERVPGVPTGGKSIWTEVEDGWAC
jgi:hypothetical protein